jgi:hypothetical protein
MTDDFDDERLLGVYISAATFSYRNEKWPKAIVAVVFIHAMSLLHNPHLHLVPLESALEAAMAITITAWSRRSLIMN